MALRVGQGLIYDRTAIVGLGATPYYRRGASAPRSLEELVGKSILAAASDAGIDVRSIDGFAYFAGGFDTGMLTETLGIPEIRFSATLTGTGGGSAGAIGLAADRPRPCGGCRAVLAANSARLASQSTLRRCSLTTAPVNLVPDGMGTSHGRPSSDW